MWPSYWSLHHTGDLLFLREARRSILLLLNSEQCLLKHVGLVSCCFSDKLVHKHIKLNSHLFSLVENVRVISCLKHHERLLRDSLFLI